MEGLIPFVYKAIMQYKYGTEGPIGSWLCESPSYSYMRLPGDSGRFQASASFSAISSSPSSKDANSSSSSSSATQIIVSSGIQSAHRRLTPRRVAA